MPRRKQSKPRSCKRGLDAEESSGMETNEGIKDEIRKHSSLYADTNETIESKPIDTKLPDDHHQAAVAVAAAVAGAGCMSEPSDLYSCQLCSASFPNLVLFVEHRKFDCTTGNHQLWSHCSKSIKKEFASRSASEESTATAPPPPPYHQCPWCSLKFLRLKDLARHEQVVHQRIQKDYETPQPKSSQGKPEVEETGSDRFASGKRSKNSDFRLVSCPECPFVCHDVKLYAEHLKLHFDKSQTKNIKEEFDLKYEHSTDGLFAISSPSNSCFSTAPNFATSTKIVAENYFQSDEIAKRENNNNSSADEIDQSASKKRKSSYPCSHCPVEFLDKNTLKMHTESIHNKKVVPTPPSNHSSSSTGSNAVGFCSQCSKKFDNIYDLTDHVHIGHEFNSESPLLPKSYFTFAGLPLSSAGASCRELQAILLESSFATSVFSENHFDRQVLMGQYMNQSVEYGCSSCLKSFPKADELQKHLMEVHACHLYKCSLCKLIFDSKVDIQVHFAVKHSSECTVYKCNQCPDLVFKSDVEWQLHVRIFHLGLSNPYKCLFCKDSFLTEPELLAHISLHEKQFVCPGCDEAFLVEYLLDKHIETKHASSLSPKVSKEFSHLKRSGSKASTFYAQNEEMSYLSSENESISPKSKKLLKRQFSEAKLYNESGFKKHHLHGHSSDRVASLKVSRSTPTRDKNLSASPTDSVEKMLQFCLYCKQTFKTKLELEKHMKIHHVSPNNQKCNICDEVFSSSLVLAEHKLTHCKVVQSNLCTVCKSTMSGESEFYSHCHEHSSQGTNMQCTVCRQTLASSIEMQLHGKHHFHQQQQQQQQKPTLPCSDAITKCDICFSVVEPRNHAISLPFPGTREGSFSVCLKCFQKENFELAQYFYVEAASRISKSTETSAFNGKTYQCIKCQQSFASEYEIQLHVASHLFIEGNVHECLLCSKTFSSPAKLQIHLIEHSFPNKHYMSCYMCSEMFSKASDLHQHMLSGHGLSSRKFGCADCPLTFFFSAELENHQLTCHCSSSSSSSRKSVFKKPAPSAFKNEESGTKKLKENDNDVQVNVHHETNSSVLNKLNTDKLKFTVKSYENSDSNQSYDCEGSGSSDSSLDRETSENGKAGESQKSVKCPDCDQLFLSTTSFQNHAKSHNLVKENLHDRLELSPAPKDKSTPRNMESNVKTSWALSNGSENPEHSSPSIFYETRLLHEQDVDILAQSLVKTSETHCERSTAKIRHEQLEDDFRADDNSSDGAKQDDNSEQGDCKVKEISNSKCEDTADELLNIESGC